ncbi:PPOX class F420-dependent oxidoreductase [Streptomyces gobiensis]|uniref:PPOX class F420-dependent oxidoreductase n=1 Tax=Streptomyces gobiensis TaxID=2875706 RepID=UPI001E3FCF91|nr:PPOX class F420-dependent oxidoreductase [Streptomyces gobiensis]UGY90817.1 PPOX class F420-dependent oxidoreductase [Streptomyces gobiensis]
MTDDGARGRGLVVTVALLAGLGTGTAGLWSLLWPRSFATAVQFPYHEHFLHDIGAFQLGLATTLLLACIWYDALATALTGFLLGNTIHTINHAVDLDHGGQNWHIAALALASAAVALALALRLRQLGWVVGGVRTAAHPELAPYVRQKTVLLATYNQHGHPGRTPVSLAVDGERAYIRTFENALKTRRIAHNPDVLIAPCTARGKHPGPTMAARARRLTGAEARYAARLLRTKHPLLHGIVVPLAHKVLLRKKTGGTVHFEVWPTLPE